MQTLVFDIETVGEQWSSLDKITQESLLKWAKRSARDEKERSVLEQNVREELGLLPLTGMIVAIGLYDVERQQGVVYYQSGKEVPEYELDDYIFRSRTEKEMLEDFWEGAQAYDTFVTFNGRRFDIPYLMLRSVVHEIKPTKELMEGRYLYQQKSIKHIDLMDQLTFYGAMYKKPSLHLFTRAFGIQSSKDGGVAGEVVAELFKKKKFKEIAEYNSRDVIATTALYHKWLDYLAPSSFSEGIDIV